MHICGFLAVSLVIAFIHAKMKKMFNEDAINNILCMYKANPGAGNNKLTASTLESNYVTSQKHLSTLTNPMCLSTPHLREI